MTPGSFIYAYMASEIAENGISTTLSYRYSENPFIFMLVDSNIILSMTIFLTVAAAVEKTSEKSFYYEIEFFSKEFWNIIINIHRSI